MAAIKVLVLSHFFFPCFKAGGPVRSLVNLTSLLGEEHKFTVFTSCYDLDKARIENIEFDTKVDSINSTEVVYHSGYFSLLNNTFSTDFSDYSHIYINSYFDFRYSISVLFSLLIKRYKGKVLLAPRGELTFGAMKFGKFKKKLYILMYLRFFRSLNVTFHFTSEQEESEAKIILGEDIKSVLIPNMHEKLTIETPIKKNKGKLKLLYLSRIVDKKNLFTALLSLKNIPEENRVIFKIAGPVDSEEYWKKCLDVIDELPSNIEVSFVGALDRIETIKAFRESHAFILPTYNENFGHAIVEGCSLGCIPVISDSTPWSDVEYSGGYVCKPEDDTAFSRAIIKLCLLENDNYLEQRLGVIDFVKLVLNKNEQLIRGMFSNV